MSEDMVERDGSDWIIAADNFGRKVYFQTVGANEWSQGWDFTGDIALAQRFPSLEAAQAVAFAMGPRINVAVEQVHLNQKGVEG